MNIEWVEIPAGKFQSGLSDSQRKWIQEIALDKANLNQLTTKEQQIVQEYLRFYRGESTREPQHDELFRIERKNPEIKNLFAVEISMSHEWPVVIREVESFYISRFPITFQQVYTFLRASDIPDLRKPLKTNQRNLNKFGSLPSQESRREITEFCRWLNANLPTPVQWKYAARGSESLLYPWGNQWNPLNGNFAATTGLRPRSLRHTGQTTPVDAYPNGVSPFGLYDMTGNLPEHTGPVGIAGSFPYMGVDIEYSHAPAWYFYMAHYQSGYVKRAGFRPMRNQWPRSLWPGANLDSPAA